MAGRLYLKTGRINNVSAIAVQDAVLRWVFSH